MASEIERLPDLQGFLPDPFLQKLPVIRPHRPDAQYQLDSTAVTSPAADRTPRPEPRLADSQTRSRKNPRKPRRPNGASDNPAGNDSIRVQGKSGDDQIISTSKAQPANQNDLLSRL